MFNKRFLWGCSMALMIPDEVQSFTTEGEGKFYRFRQLVVLEERRAGEADG
jgi:hypothetical protein